MRRAIGVLSFALLALGLLVLLTFGMSAYGQNQAQTPDQAQTPSAPPPTNATTEPAGQKPARSAGGDVGSGTGDIAKGAGKGAGDLAKGTGKGAVDLATLHPVDAAGAVGKGGASAGKNVVVGTAKGTGQIVKGTGKAIKKIF
jgi:hypothetical protein